MKAMRISSFKIGLTFVASLLCLMILMPCGAPSSAHAADDTLSVVYCGDLAPFEYTDKAGKPAGMLIDYWNLWSVKTGVKVNFIPAAWRDTLTMVKEGKADAHAGLFYNEERAAYLSYSPAPLTKTEVDKYYKEDKLIWMVFLGLRRLDRFFATRLLWKRYEFILPGKIKR